jgi:hypothetical protein
LLNTNVIAGGMPSGEYALAVDCSDNPNASQRCRAEPEHLRFANNASASDSYGHVVAAGTSVVEAAIRVTASPAAARDDDCSHSCDANLQSGGAAVETCSSMAKWAAKWAARAVIVFLTAGLTFVTRP